MQAWCVEHHAMASTNLLCFCSKDSHIGLFCGWLYGTGLLADKMWQPTDNVLIVCNVQVMEQLKTSLQRYETLDNMLTWRAMRMLTPRQRALLFLHS
jgi:hypothetical protein